MLAGGCGVHIIEQEAKVIKEYDHDEELKHLGYSASLLGGSTAAVADMLKTTRVDRGTVLVGGRWFGRDDVTNKGGTAP